MQLRGVRIILSVFRSGQTATITTVSLRGCALDSAHLALLLPTLSQCVALTHLDLSDNNLTAEGVEALVSALLQPGSRLRDLRLANNWLGPAGVCALAGPLVANTGLQYLDLSNTSARPADALRLDSDQRALQALADALKVSLLLIF